VAQRKTAFSASIAKNKPPKDQPNSRVVARSLIDQQRGGGMFVQNSFVSPKRNELGATTFLHLSNFCWEEGLFGPIEAA
jgi:hypothetical protein